MFLPVAMAPAKAHRVVPLAPHLLNENPPLIQLKFISQEMYGSLTTNEYLCCDGTSNMFKYNLRMNSASSLTTSKRGGDVDGKYSHNVNPWQRIFIFIY
jgi:hypothetical protein